MNPYTVLGVPRDADTPTIKKAYRKARGGLHPDRSQGDHEKMAALNVAYDILSDPERRARWDASQDTSRFVKTEETHARELVMALFQEVMGQKARINIPARVAAKITEAREVGRRTLAEVDAALAHWAGLKGQIETDEPDNLAEGIIEAQLRHTKDKRESVERDLKRLEMALEIAQRYRHGVIEPVKSPLQEELAAVTLRAFSQRHRHPGG